MASNNNGRGGISFTGLLAIVFITLKLMNYIQWPWFWVLAPIWGSAIIVLLIVVVAIIVAIANEG